LDKRLHVILLTSGRIYGTAHGGEDRFTNSFGNWLVSQKHKVTLMGIDFAGLRVRHLSSGGESNESHRNETKRVASRGLSFKLALSFRFLSYSLRIIIWMFQVLRILSINLRSQVTLISAQDSGYTGLAAVIASKILGVPVVISLHGIRYNEIESNPFLNESIKKTVLGIEGRLDRFTLKNANLVTVVSSSLIDYVKRVVPDKSVKVLPVAVKSNKFEYSKSSRDSVRSQLGIRQQATVVGFIGRMSHEKNLFMLLKSFASASIDDPHLMLVLVGQGMLEIELRRMVDKLNIQGKVIFCGVREDIGAILSSFDIFVLPSFIEALSNALLEAMSSGRAIICSDIRGNRELIRNNIEGLLVDPNDPKSLASKIQLLSRDESLRRRLGNNAKYRAREYSEEMVFPKILDDFLMLTKN
jgi:glycosyltransferase involved in cell wall biosynthesis